MFEFAKIYIRSIVAIVAMSTTVMYLGDATMLVEYFAACVAAVYLDKEVSPEKANLSPEKIS